MPSPGQPAFVVDCSVSIAWVFPSQADAYTESVLDALATAPGLVPKWWDIETLNVLLALERRDKLSTHDAHSALRLLHQLPIQRFETTASLFELHALARRYRLSSYDTLYLDAAIKQGLPLASRDKALILAAEESGIGVWQAATTP